MDTEIPRNLCGCVGFYLISLYLIYSAYFTSSKTHNTDHQLLVITWDKYGQLLR